MYWYKLEQNRMADLYKLAFVIFVCTNQPRASAENLGFLAVEDPPKIYKTTLSNTITTLQFTKVIDTGEGGPRQVAYDPVDKMIYWTEFDNDVIRRCDLDGNNPASFDTTPSSTTEPHGIALDVVNRVVYYTSSESEGVAYVDMDLIGPATRITQTSGVAINPRGMAYDSVTGTLYFGYRQGDEELNSINVDGSNRKTLHRGSGNYLGVFVNGTAQELFYNELVPDQISFMDLTETPLMPVVLYNGANPTNRPYGLTVYEEHVYWCDHHDAAPDSLYRIAKDGSDGPNSPTTVTATYDDSATLTDCRDIHFYIETPCVLNAVVTSDAPTQLSVKWDAATALCPADVYRIDYEAINIDQCGDSDPLSAIVWQSVTTTTLMDLKPYTTYRIAVRPGLYADSGSVIREGESLVEYKNTTGEVPSNPPDDLRYVIRETTVSFTWLGIPCGSRGGPIESYSYKMYLDNEVINSGVTSSQEVILNNPSCGTVRFEVAGINNVGTGVYGDVSYSLTSSEPFMSDAELLISDVTQTSAVVSWDETVCSPSEYTIEYTLIDQCQSTRVEQESITTSEATVILDDLEPGSIYEVSIRAMTNDNNPRQLTTEFITFASEPLERPMNPRWTPYTSGNTAQISWDAIPCESRGTYDENDLYYSYRVFVDGGEIRSSTTTDTTVTVGNLPCGIISFQVAAVNDVGTGPWSNFAEYDVNLSDTFRTDEPIDVVAITSTSVYLTWKGNACLSSPFTINYVLTNIEQCEPVNIASTFGQTTESSATLTGLRPGSTYDVTVSAPTTLAFGNERVLRVTITTANEGPTRSPGNVRLTSSGSTSLSFDWEEVPCGSRGGAIMYEYELSQPSNPFFIATEETGLTFATIDGLQEGKEYVFSVVAVSISNGDKRSPSSEVSAATEQGPDGTSVIIGLSFAAVAFVIIILAVSNGLIYFRRIYLPRNNSLVQNYDEYGGAYKNDFPGIRSPFEFQRVGQVDQLGIF